VAEATGILPLDYMLSVMRDPNVEMKRRDAMAIAAAPYLHSKLSTVEASEVRHHDPNSAEAVGIQVVFVKPTRRDCEEEELLNGHKLVEDPVNLETIRSGSPAVAVHVAQPASRISRDDTRIAPPSAFDRGPKGWMS
jgi:hypothetical protein